MGAAPVLEQRAMERNAAVNGNCKLLVAFANYFYCHKNIISRLRKTEKEKDNKTDTETEAETKTEIEIHSF